MNENISGLRLENKSGESYRQLLNSYTSHLRAANRSSKTISWYHEILLRFFSFLEIRGLLKPVEEIGSHELKTYIIHLQSINKWQNHNYIKEEKGKLSAYSIQGHVRAIKAFFNWLEREEHIEHNQIATFLLPKVPQYMVKTLSVEQVRKLISAIDRYTSSGMKYYVILLLLLDTGMRISELVNIKISEIDFTCTQIRIMGKGQKERIVPFCSQTRKELLRYMKNFRSHLGREDSIYLFQRKDGSHISINSVQQFLRRLAIKAGLHGIKCSPHILRHYFATQSIANEANVFALKDIMGHASLQTTLKYTHMQPQDLKVQHTKFSPVAKLMEG